MALTANSKVPVRASATGPIFGYPAAPGVHIFAGALLNLNAAGQLQPIQADGGVAFAGMASGELNNVGVATASPLLLEVRRGVVVKMNVPAAIYANIGAPVYATDDSTLTLSSNSGANIQVGTLAGFEGGTWLKVTS
jgi:hypothetical protein